MLADSETPLLEHRSKEYNRLLEQFFNIPQS